MKKIIILSVLIALNLLSGQDIIKKHSALNFVKDGEYDKAIKIYSGLLDDNPDDPSLLYNLGTTLLLKNDVDKSIENLQKASATDDKELLEKVYYNLGNAYYRKKEYANALGSYKKALKLNYRNKNTRENLELSLRAQQKQKQQQQNQDNQKKKKMEPSEFAKQLKKKALEMARNHQYSGAYNLMQQGMKKDKSVAAFGDFINRLKTVAEIAEG